VRIATRRWRVRRGRTGLSTRSGVRIATCRTPVAAGCWRPVDSLGCADRDPEAAREMQQQLRLSTRSGVRIATRRPPSMRRWIGRCRLARVCGSRRPEPWDDPRIVILSTRSGVRIATWFPFPAAALDRLSTRSGVRIATLRELSFAPCWRCRLARVCGSRLHLAIRVDHRLNLSTRSGVRIATPTTTISPAETLLSTRSGVRIATPSA